MENKGLLNLPETWHVRVDENNKSILEKWFKNFYPNCIGLDNYPVVGYSSSNSNRPTKSTHSSGSFGQEITFADFKRLVLGEKNADDYGVAGSDELEKYFYKINCDLSGGLENAIYFRGKGIWYDTSLLESKRQTLPLQEYLKLIEPETMEKYEYKLRDEKYLQAVNKLLDINEHYSGINISHDSKLFHLLNNDNVLDLFFEKIEVKEDKVTIIDKQCVNSKYGASWLDGGCECGFKCKVKVEIERNGHNPYIYILDEKEYKKLLNK